MNEQVYQTIAIFMSVAAIAVAYTMDKRKRRALESKKFSNGDGGINWGYYTMAVFSACAWPLTLFALAIGGSGYLLGKEIVKYLDKNEEKKS